MQGRGARGEGEGGGTYASLTHEGRGGSAEEGGEGEGAGEGGEGFPPYLGLASARGFLFTGRCHEWKRGRWGGGAYAGVGGRAQEGLEWNTTACR